MDQDDAKIEFDDVGVCNHCRTYLSACEFTAEEKANFLETIDKLRNTRERVIVGISGGVDSTFLAWYSDKILGLNIVLVHVDNGWNTATSVKNMNNLIRHLNAPFYNVVLDWREFQKMQLSILEAGVPDLEAPTDLFINYTLRRTARDLGIKTILAGTNPQTEHVMGYNWSYGQRDPIYLRNLYKKYMGFLPKNLPLYRPIWAAYQKFTHGINVLRPLKYIDYSNNGAQSTIKKEVNWQSYDRKHGESFITTFYQDYFLPTRFGYDKRKAHYSSLILNGELSRAQALQDLNKDRTSFDIEADIKFFCEKLQIDEKTFFGYMEMPKRFHENFYTMKNTPVFRLARYIKNNFIDLKILKWAKRFMES